MIKCQNDVKKMVCGYKLIWGEVFFMSSMEWRLFWFWNFFDIACNSKVTEYTDIQVVNFH